MSVNISYETDILMEIEDYEKVIKDVIGAVLESEKCPYEAELNVSIVDDDEIHAINSEFREIDRSTDVLSFPALEYSVPGDFKDLEDQLEANEDMAVGMYFNPDTGELMLGDIMVSAEHVIEQAKEYGHSRKRELAFLVAHSMFHLLGYDHMEKDEAAVMENKQEKILEDLGITRDI